MNLNNWNVKRFVEALKFWFRFKTSENCPPWLHLPESRLELKKDHLTCPSRPTSFAGAGHVSRSTKWWLPCRAPLKEMSACTWFGAIWYLESQRAEQWQQGTRRSRSFPARLLRAALLSGHMFSNRRKGGILKMKEAEILASWKQGRSTLLSFEIRFENNVPKMEMTSASDKDDLPFFLLTPAG